MYNSTSCGRADVRATLRRGPPLLPCMLGLHICLAKTNVSIATKLKTAHKLNATKFN